MVKLSTFFSISSPGGAGGRSLKTEDKEKEKEKEKENVKVKGKGKQKEKQKEKQKLTKVKQKKEKRRLKEEKAISSQQDSNNNNNNNHNNSNSNNLFLRGLSALNSLSQPRRMSQEPKPVTILILGTGQSGKSTLFKHFNFEGPKSTRFPNYKETLQYNVLNSMDTIIYSMKKLEIFDEENEISENSLYVDDLNNAKQLKEKREIIAKYWRNRAIREAFWRSEFSVLGSAPYYFEHANRILQTDYVPNEEDYLRSYVKTISVYANSFDIGNTTFKIYDVGGQRVERKKWLLLMEEVTFVIFLVSLTEFNEILSEDHSQNRLEESLRLFERLLESPQFKNVPVLLIFNKAACLKEKLKRISFSKYFPDFKGENEFEPVSEYILKMFCQKERRKESLLFPYFVDILDSQATQPFLKQVCQKVTENYTDIPKANQNWSYFSSISV